MSADHPSGVLVVGESIVDVVETHGRATAHAGGSPANVALGLTRLDRSPLLLTSLGSDVDGRFLADFFADNGVAIAPESFTAESTSRAVARIQSDGSAQYDFDVRWSLPTVHPAPVPRLMHTGSIAAFLSPGADAVRDLLVSATGRSLVTFDPNIRSSLIGDHDSVRERFELLCSLADVVKLSDEDAEWLYPDGSPESVLQRVLAGGTALAVVTLGERGALIGSSAAIVTVPAVSVEVVDTIGAGDAFMACLIAAVLDLTATTVVPVLSADELETLGRRCALAAAITVSRAGAQPPTADELSAAASVS